MLTAFEDSSVLPDDMLMLICSDFDFTSLVSMSTVSKVVQQRVKRLLTDWLRIKFPKISLDNKTPDVLSYLKSIIWYFSANSKIKLTLNEPSQLREILYGLWIMQCYFLPKELPQLDMNSLFPENIQKTDILRVMLDFAAKNNLICVFERFLGAANLEISVEERKTLLTEVFVSSANKGRLEVMTCLKVAPEISKNLEYITNFHSLFEKAARRGDTDMLLFLKVSTKVKPFCMNAALELAKRNNQDKVINLFSTQGWLSEIEESDFDLLQEPQNVELTFSSKSSKSKKSSRPSYFNSEDLHDKEDKHKKKRDNCCIQ
jgi:hypothetical protein